MGFMDGLSWAMPAGFYYRVFHKPAAIWPTAIKQIRQAAGIGILSPDFRMKGRFDEIYPCADVCVIGGGPAGMAAALAAAERSAGGLLDPALAGAPSNTGQRPTVPGYSFSEDGSWPSRLNHCQHPRLHTRPAIGVYSDGQVTFQHGDR
jgi:hypothetical protein